MTYYKNNLRGGPKIKEDANRHINEATNARRMKERRMEAESMLKKQKK